LRSIWSYTGFVLALIVAAALIVPGYMDWSRYAGVIEARAEALTGRDVEITGDVRIALLPSPKLTLGAMTIANAPGAHAEHLLEVAGMAAEVSVAALLRGDLVVSRLTLDSPRVWLEQTVDGGPNWHFTAPPTSPGGPPAGKLDARDTLPAVAIGEIAVSSGEVVVRHPGLGGGGVRVTAVEALLDAESLRGPFRAKGQMVLGGRAAAFSAALGDVSADDAYPASLSLTVDGVEAQLRGHLTGGGADMRFDGTLSAGLTADLSPLVAALTAAQPVVVTAGVAIGRDAWTVRDLAAEAGAVKLAGKVTATLDPVVRVEAVLQTNRADIAGLAGAGVPLDADALARALGVLIDYLPTGIYDIGADEVRLASGTVRDMRLVAEAGEQVISVLQLDARLPGAADVAAHGVAAIGADGPYFSGDVTLSSADAAGLARWLGGGAPPTLISAMPLHTLNCTALVFLTSAHMRLDTLDIVLDGGRIAGRVATTFAARPDVSVALEAEQIALPDMDPSVLEQAFAGGRVDLGFDGDVRLDVAQIDIGAVQLADVRVDLEADGGTVTLRELLFKSRHGASATVSGASTPGKGQYQATLTASDAASFEGVLPMPPRVLEGARSLLLTAQAAWPSDVPLAAAQNPATTVALSVLGRLDDMDLEATGRVAPGAHGLADAAYEVTASVAADAWPTLVRLSGALAGLSAQPAPAAQTVAQTAAQTEEAAAAGPVVQEAREPDAPRRQTITAAIKGVRGAPMVLAASADLDVFSGLVAGSIETAPGASAFDLDVTAKTSAPVALAHALGVPLQGVDAAQFDGQLAFDGAAGTYDLTAATVRIEADGRIIDADATGRLYVPGGDDTSADSAGGAESADRADRAGSVSIVSHETDLILAGRLLAGTYLAPRAGVPAADAPAPVGVWGTDPFDMAWLTGIDLDIALSGDGLSLGRLRAEPFVASGRLQDGVLTLTDMHASLFGGELRASGSVAVQDGLTVEASLAARAVDAARALTALGLDAVAGGTGDMDIAVAGNGLSGLALISSLKGEGSLDVRDGALTGMDLAKLSAGLQDLEQIEDFAPLVDAALTSGSTPFDAVTGNLTMTAGVLRAPGIDLALPDGRATTAAFVDFGRLALDIETRVHMREPEDAPAVDIIYAGDFSTAERTVNTVELETYAARRLIERKLEGLDDAPLSDLRAILEVPEINDEAEPAP